MAPQSRSWGFPRWRGYGTSQEATVKRMCDRDQCNEPGDFKAPVSPRKLSEFYWFCRNHAEEYNRGWDYFQGRKPEDVFEEEKKTQWNGRQSDWDTVEEDSYVGPEVRDAMNTLGLARGDGMEVLKESYKRLVKEHHPDIGGDPEVFKAITAAYGLLLERLS